MFTVVEKVASEICVAGLADVSFCLIRGVVDVSSWFIQSLNHPIISKGYECSESVHTFMIPSMCIKPMIMRMCLEKSDVSTLVDASNVHVD